MNLSATVPGAACPRHDAFGERAPKSLKHQNVPWFVDERIPPYTNEMELS
jgi:hypothetical protein